MWIKRDHKTEWRQWEGWLDHIAAGVKRIDGVTTQVGQPNEGLSNRSPRLSIQWDGARLGITGQEVSKLLLETEPRIVVAGATGNRPESMTSSVAIVPYMMMAGDEKVIADRLYAVLSKPPKFENPAPPSGQPAMVAGQWEARLEFGRGSANHRVVLEQDGATLMGTHHGEFYSGDLTGTVAGNTVRFRSSHRVHGTRLSYDFTGTLDGDKLSGTVNLGEYGQTSWKAQKHKYESSRRRRNG